MDVIAINFKATYIWVIFWTIQIMTMVIMAIVSMEFMAICSRVKNKVKYGKTYLANILKIRKYSNIHFGYFFENLGHNTFPIYGYKKNQCPRPNSAKSFLC